VKYYKIALKATLKDAIVLMRLPGLSLKPFRPHTTIRFCDIINNKTAVEGFGHTKIHDIG